MPQGSGAKRRVGIIVNTPAQVHFYRHIYHLLLQHGHEAFIIARGERETLDLLHDFELPYTVFCSPPGSKMDMLLSLPRNVIDATGILRERRVDIVTGFGVYDAYASALLGASNIVFIDNEPGIGKRSYQVQFHLFFPFVDTIVTPSFFREDLGRKHVRIEGMKEFAYLHPNRYRPDDSILDVLGVGRGERFSLLRFNSLSAFHDLGVGGFTMEQKIMMARELERHGQVFISSEKGLPRELEKWAISIPKRRVHDVLTYASLLVTDTQTMATEAAILGTPTVRCNSFVGARDMGNFIELENRYHLLFNYRDPAMAIAKATELVKDEGAKAEWGRRRSALLRDSIDVTAFMTWYIENYPQSYRAVRETSGVLDRFR